MIVKIQVRTVTSNVTNFTIETSSEDEYNKLFRIINEFPILGVLKFDNIRYNASLVESVEVIDVLDNETEQETKESKWV